MTTQPCLPEAALSGLDALVVAGMGTGTLSQGVIGLLAPKWTKQIPVVLTSQCLTGWNFDEYLYPGSLAKYEEMGFLVKEYSMLTPAKARMKIALAISQRKT